MGDEEQEHQQTDVVSEESNVSIQPEQPETPEEKKDEISEEEKKLQAEEVAEEAKKPKEPHVLQKLWKKYLAKKKITFPITAVVLLLLIFSLPASRFGVLGLVVKKDLQVRVIDSESNLAVSGVDVAIRGKTAKTDGEGRATIKGVKVGTGKILANKKYYKDFTAKTVVPLGTQKDVVELKLEATGRQIPIHVTNKLNGKNVAGATIRAGDTEVQADSNGETTLVLPADQKTVQGTISAPGYNDQIVSILVTTDSVTNNTFEITPTGKVYFLSKLTGKIDVVKANLDGSDRQIVLAGTGNEEDGNTVLLASRDWKYLVLQARRDGDKAKLYLLDASNDGLTEIDSGNAGFTLAGWSDHHFVYTVERYDVSYWQAQKYAIKTYNADTKQLLTIDETNAEGTSDSDYATESFGTVYLVNDKAVYTKTWYANYYSAYRLSGKRMGVVSVKTNGLEKQTIKDFDASSANNYLSTTLYKPGEVYVRAVIADTTSFYEYDDEHISEVNDTNDEAFYKNYPTFLQSPSGQNTFWYESRDGKNTLFVGTKAGENGKQIATLSEYTPYGWYSDDYLLVSKNSSELYILPRDGGKDPLKITDYHKPDYTYYGYGGGYGGL